MQRASVPMGFLDGTYPRHYTGNMELATRRRLELSFLASIVIHLFILALFALLTDVDVRSLPPQARKIIVEFIEQPPGEEDSVVPEEIPRMAARTKRVKKETAPREISPPAKPPPDKEAPKPQRIEKKAHKPKLRAPERGGEDSETKMRHPITTIPKEVSKPEEIRPVDEIPPVELKREEKDLPKLSQLLPTMEELAEQVRREERIRDVEEGETISLDTREFKYLSYFSKLKDKIRMVWEYPKSARMAGLEGRLLVRFVINDDGSLRYVEVMRSSGIPVLDDAALRAVRKAAPFPPVPEDLGRSLNIVATFEYVLTAARIR